MKIECTREELGEIVRDALLDPQFLTELAYAIATLPLTDAVSVRESPSGDHVEVVVNRDAMRKHVPD
jgi:hypothetical protein